MRVRVPAALEHSSHAVTGHTHSTAGKLVLAARGSQPRTHSLPVRESREKQEQ